MIERANGDSADSGARSGLRQRIFAWAQARTHDVPSDYDTVVNQHKRRLFADLSGTVLEFGAGTGENFPFYPPGIHWIGVEPNLYMQNRLLEAAKGYPLDGELRTGVAERLPVDDASVDAVVGTLVMCSVSDQAQALSEIMRVLRPGGRYVFVEHVAADQASGLYKMQGVIQPVWTFLGDGCHPNRDTAAAIERAGFAQVEITPFRAPVPFVGPHIAGYAIK